MRARHHEIAMKTRYAGHNHGKHTSQLGQRLAHQWFDTGLVHVGEMESHSGNQFSLLRGLVGSEFNLYWDEFKTSNKLRIQVGLPWAGDTVIEFDTSGASEALDKIPCEERSLAFAQQCRQLGDIRRDPPLLILQRDDRYCSFRSGALTTAGVLPHRPQ